MTVMPRNSRDFMESLAGYVLPSEGTRGTSGSAPQRSAKLATIDPNFNGSSTPRVTFDGEVTMSGKGYTWLLPYVPTAGDRVVMEPVGNSYVILGEVAKLTTSYDTGWITTGLTPYAGITLTTYRIRRVGSTVYVALDPFTVDSLSVPVSGDIGNKGICTVPSLFIPTAVQPLGSSSTGRLASGYINGAGAISMSAVVPDVTATGTATLTNTQFSLGGSYVI